MPHITLEPKEIDVLHGMTLQDLRCCELALKNCVPRFREIGGDHKEAAERLEDTYTRVERARRVAERDAAHAEMKRRGGRGQWALVQP